MKIIECPACKQLQVMEHDKTDNIYFPVRPYCCPVMEHSDTTEWNKQLDLALKHPRYNIGFKYNLGELVVH